MICENSIPFSSFITDCFTLLDLDWVAKGAIEIVDLNSEDLRVICTLSQKYSDLPMDFADASLVHISEKLGIKSVISIDSDFSVYRTLSNGYLTNLLVQ